MSFFIELGIMIGIIILAAGIADAINPGLLRKDKWQKQKAAADARSKSQTEVLQAYERLVKEKLDVIKTALAMGYKDHELEQLDARLEKLIGQDKLDAVLSGSPAPMADQDLLDTDLESELRRIKQQSAGK